MRCWILVVLEGIEYFVVKDGSVAKDGIEKPRWSVQKQNSNKNMNMY
jgi:hypothetical protein